MDFDQLRSFVEVARLKNFSRAAGKLGLTQPAISTQIRQLEEEFGVRLFDRIGKKVFLTQPGILLLDHAGKILNVQKEAFDALRDLLPSPAGHLLLGATEASCLYLLPKVFAAFKKKHPEVKITVYRNFTTKIVQKLQEDSVDLGFVSLPVDVREIATIPLFREPVDVAVPAGHPLASKASVTVEEIARYPWIFPRASRTRQTLDELFRGVRQPVHVTMELSGVETIKRFIVIGLGISLLSRSYAAAEVKAGTLKLIPLAEPRLERQLGLAYRTDRYLSRSTQAFIDIAAKHFDRRHGAA
ncbi:MAG TPA: LysR family transcriptional regulator [Bryobacterales bacterium]|nr:LysR family transcriptional regulator [Bryobacterales bacterium]